ncbi:uncharacterized protein LOC143431806 [Xylocopa sonorina]|uniref:uncharacterized protein LOC143431806 n=1 Tax=Xylocopa sonorina TaxID=1818115 RepID=UPI00403AC146
MIGCITAKPKYIICSEVGKTNPQTRHVTGANNCPIYRKALAEKNENGMELRILQINLNRCQIAQEIMQQTKIIQRIDAVIISEPYKMEGYWLQDEIGDAAIWITGLNEKCFTYSTVYSAPGIVQDREFEEYIDKIEEHIEKGGRTDKIIIAGDLNAKSMVWGSRRSDKRGEMIIEMAIRRNLLVTNPKGDYTYFKNSYKSKIDIMLMGGRTYRELREAEVLEIFSGSDHQYVLHTFQNLNHRQNGVGFISLHGKKADWKNASKWYKEEIKKINLRIANEEIWIEKYEEMVNKVAHKQIVDKIKQSKKIKRKLVRSRKRKEQEETKKLRKLVKIKKRELKKLIKNSKTKCLESYIQILDRDPWGKPYNVVMSKIRSNNNNKGEIKNDDIKQIINTLFITWNPKRHPRVEIIDAEEIEAKGIDFNKAPAADGIPQVFTKWLVENKIEDLRKIFNATLKVKKIPRNWKIARRVLLKKPGKEGIKANDYGPLCIIGGMGKIWQAMIKNRIEKQLGPNGIHRNQYGFKKYNSTIDAVRTIQEITKQARKMGQWCALMTVDIKNAFNTIKWRNILIALRKHKISKYLRDVIPNYLSNRSIKYYGKKETIIADIYGGIPQGSILGSLMWNLAYNDIFQKIKTNNNITIIGYADDTAIIGPREIEFKLKDNLKIKSSYSKQNNNIYGMVNA